MTGHFAALDYTAYGPAHQNRCCYRIFLPCAVRLESTYSDPNRDSNPNILHPRPLLYYTTLGVSTTEYWREKYFQIIHKYLALECTL